MPTTPPAPPAPSRPTSSAGAHDLTPPTSSVSHDTEPGAARRQASSTVSDKVHGTAEEVKGKLGGNADAKEEGRKRRQGAGMRKGDDE